MEALNVMTLAVTTIHPDAWIEDAHALMLKMGARHLPVLADGKLIGILSDRDVLLCAGRSGDAFVYPRLKVRDQMSGAPVTAAIHTPVTELASLMLEHKIDAVPIIASDGELLGLVTSTDLLRVVRAGLPRSENAIE